MMEQTFSIGTIIWTTVGVFLTFCLFSFLYKDNPFYKFAEHLVVGVSVGYWAILLYYTNFRQNLLDHLFRPGTWTPKFDELHYIIPAILGIAMWTRFSKKYSWISRYPLALFLGISSGIAIPVTMKNNVLSQLRGTVVGLGFDWSTPGFLGVPQGIWDFVLVVGVISSLIYFFFSKEHKGAWGGAAKLGIYTLMIGFGATFGYTVMARISLLINRIQFIRDWWNMFS
jgi:hypothetical protein